MSRAIELAKRGRGFVEPNPLVGAVVVSDGAIVGEGWHERFGQAHAEVNALNAAGWRANGADLYVTLEPCCHFGKTPPCTEAVIRSGIRRVVVAMLDPFPQVAGQGVARLREAGIVVEVGAGEVTVAAHQLNAPYLKRLRGRAWVHAKWAMTLDGKIATRTGQSKWITGEAARGRVHELRGHMDAIIVGRGTLVADDPLLTARPPGPRTPTRIVLTTQPANLPESCQLLGSAQVAPILIVSTENSGELPRRWIDHGAGLLRVPKLDVKALLNELAERGMTNVLVEGGAQTLGHFLDAGEIDEVHAFIAPKFFGGEDAPSSIGGRGVCHVAAAWKLTNTQIETIGEDMYVRGNVDRGDQPSLGPG